MGQRPLHAEGSFDEHACASILESHGIVNAARIDWNLTSHALYEEVARRREGLMAAGGPLVCRTGHHTGRWPGRGWFDRDWP